MDSNLNQNHESIWADCLKIIKDNIPAQSFKTWFDPIIPQKIEKKVLTILVPSQFFFEWIEEHFLTLLQKTLKQVLGSGARLEYKIIVDSTSSNGKQPLTINVPSANNKRIENNTLDMPLELATSIRNPYAIPGLRKINIDSQLNPKYTFENFIEGDCNRMARNAGYTISTKPGETSFNPIMIFSANGLGKTHLIHAIGNQIKQLHKQKSVLYIDCNKFVQQYIDSCKNGNNNDFINFYQYLDVLIVDDIQFLAKKEKTQEVFFQIFNHLHQNHKQIILTCDRPVKDLKDVDERLLSRFKWGLSCELLQPDYATRLAILENKMYQEGVTLNKEVVQYIANNIENNVRELEGAMISMLAQSSMNKKEIDLDLAKQILKNFVKNATKEISIEYIQKLVCEYYNIPVDMVKSQTRKREVVQARQIAMYFAKDLTKASLKNIGSYFGNRDHSTVIHACQTVGDLMETDKKYRNDVDELNKRIRINTL